MMCTMLVAGVAQKDSHLELQVLFHAPLKWYSPSGSMLVFSNLGTIIVVTSFTSNLAL